eukprot:TRINITY_DN2356_c0_g1_i5.p1 TRINITY_DN2356_c0_g1~~TRINITY_DN2356_c0_g1_i5.p1  ORF type:complete len:483 (-),score=63.60 TRINITY_DN2356_c0_g1_i5:41-1489(-)
MIPSIIRACPNRQACEGGTGVSSTGSWTQESGVWRPGWSSDAYCAAGHQGPYCAVCAYSYAAVTGYKCVECTAGIVGAVVVGVVVLFAVVALGLWVLFAAASGLGEGADATSTFAAASGTLKLARAVLIVARHLRTPVIVMQILTQFVSITGVALPLQYLDFLQVMDLISLDLRWLTSPGCVLHLSFYQRLLLTTLAPLGIAGVILAPRTYRWLRPRSASAKLQRVCEKDMNVLLVFAFLVYSGVSLTIFQTFACDYLEYDGPDGTWYLRADYTIQCRTPEHTTYVTYAAIMLLVYPLGIPALFAWMIRLGAAKSRERSALALATSFLRKPYKPRASYWECVECLRRLLLAGLLVFILPGTAGQTAVACVFAVFAGVVYESVQPHQAMGEESLYRLGYSIIAASMFTSLLIQVEYVDEYSQNAIGKLLIALNVILLVSAVTQAFLVYRKVRTTAGPVHQHSWFGLRRRDTPHLREVDPAPTS